MTRTQPRVIVLHAWVAEGGLTSVSAKHAAQTLLLYPVDVLVSTALSVKAPFDPHYDVRFGPLGAVAAITLPGLTLMGRPIQPPRGGARVVDAAQFETVLTATKGSHRQLQQAVRGLEDVWGDDWLSVDFIDVRERTPEEEEWLVERFSNKSNAR